MNFIPSSENDPDVIDAGVWVRSDGVFLRTVKTRGNSEFTMMVSQSEGQWWFTVGVSFNGSLIYISDASSVPVGCEMAETAVRGRLGLMRYAGGT